MSYFLFPGQGSQAPGMGLDFYNQSPAARSNFDEAAEILGKNFLDTVFRGTPEEVTHTRVAQAGLVMTEVAIARHMIENGLHPTCCAGHSVGEIAALVIAGALDFADALRLTRERARLMSENVPNGGMAAVMGMNPDTIAENLPEGADIANLNGPQQTIISGPNDAIDAAITQLKEAGAKRVIPLKVSGPFHSACMKEASEQFRGFLEPIILSSPTVPFVSSVTGRSESNPDTLRTLLWKQLYSSVRWTDVMQTIGPVSAFEVGPGKVLQGLAKRMEEAPTVALAGTMDAANELAAT